MNEAHAFPPNETRETHRVRNKGVRCFGIQRQMMDIDSNCRKLLLEAPTFCGNQRAKVVAGERARNVDRGAFGAPGIKRGDHLKNGGVVLCGHEGSSAGAGPCDHRRFRSPLEAMHEFVVRHFVLISLFILATGAAQAAAPSPLDDRSLGGNRYDRCLELAKANAQEALSAAIGWQNTGGGAAAQHCAAMALVELKRYPEAASRLDQMGHASVGGPAQRATLFDQAGNAWLLANRGGEAVNSFSAALALSPRDPDLLADRARAAAELHDWKAADIDLTSALKIDSNRADLLVLRASARHAMGHKGDTRADLEAALRIVPNYPEALVERGTLELESGDTKGAQQDWQTAVNRAPNSEAAATARARLSALPQAKAKAKPK